MRKDTKAMLPKIYPSIATAIKNLEQLCYKCGYDVRIETLAHELGEVDEAFFFRATLINPRNGGKATIYSEIRGPTGRVIETDFVKKINSIVEGLAEEAFGEENKKVATKILLGFMDTYFAISFLDDLDIARAVKIALETGLKIRYEDRDTYVIKNPRKSFERFLKRYLQAYGRLPIEEIDEFVNNVEAYATRCSFHSKLYKLLPPELAALYSVRSLRDPTTRDINIIRKMLFGEDPEARSKALFAIIFHLRFKRDHRLDELFAEYVREKADRAEAFSYLAIILFWELNRDADSEVLSENCPKSIKELVKKVLNIDSPISLKIIDEDYSPKIILNAGSGVQIALKKTIGVTIEVGSVNPMFRTCKTELTIEFNDPRDLGEYLWVVDEYISRSVEYLRKVEKIGMEMLSKIPSTIIKLHRIAGETVEILPVSTPTLNLTAPDTKDEELRELLESFDHDLRICSNNLSLKLGRQLLSKDELDRYVNLSLKQSNKKKEVYGI